MHKCARAQSCVRHTLRQGIGSNWKRRLKSLPEAGAPLAIASGSEWDRFQSPPIASGSGLRACNRLTSLSGSDCNAVASGSDCIATICIQSLPIASGGDGIACNRLQLLAEAGGIASNRLYTLQPGLMGCACLYTGCVLVSC